MTITRQFGKIDNAMDETKTYVITIEPFGDVYLATMKFDTTNGHAVLQDTGTTELAALTNVVVKLRSK